MVSGHTDGDRLTNSTVSISRRQILCTTAAVTAGGLAGCSSNDTSESQDNGCGDEEITVGAPDGTTHCVRPVEADQSVSAYYAYDTNVSGSASTPDELATNNATVTFCYRDTTSDTLSLVVINGDARSTAGSGGAVPMTITGVSDAQWQVQDGRPGSGYGDLDPYQTDSGDLGDSESVIWGWDNNRTDGGAVGPLGESFDLTLTSQSEGSVGDQSRTRSGLNQWLFVDGADQSSPIELATIEEDSGDLSVTIRRG